MKSNFLQNLENLGREKNRYLKNVEMRKKISLTKIPMFFPQFFVCVLSFTEKVGTGNFKFYKRA